MTHSPSPGLRDVAVWTPDVRQETRADGTTLVWRADALPAYPDRLTDCIDHWAQARPDTTWMAERDGNGWRRVTYAGLREAVRRVGGWLLDHGLSAERPLLILSGNSLEHAMIALAAQYVGVPSAAVSPAYSLISQDFGKLRDVSAQITPGLIFAKSAESFAPAIRAVISRDVPVVSVSGNVDGFGCTLWDQIKASSGSAVDAAHQAITPDTVAKFLFTSGTTGSPKAVIQTNRMLCSNQEMTLDCYAFMRDEPPVVVDWAPWNHVASGNKVFNMVLYNGGTFYIDAGKPSPAGIAETIRNLRDISPTWYFNVPAGYEALVTAMETDVELRRSFFARLRMMMYAGAGLASHTWTRLRSMAEETVGERILLATGLGSTETAPFALFCTDEQETPGNIGIPSRGVVMKLVPQDDKLEVRLKGPNITPGYWRAQMLTADAFDAEGFYRLGDAVRYAVLGQPEKGFFFDGRIAENFKLPTGTWVAVGALRAQLVDQFGGLVRDVVIVGENRDSLGALLVPALQKMRDLVPPGTAADEIADHPAVRAALVQKLSRHAASATGSASRVTRALVLTDPLSLDLGEVTDKGSVNQRAVLRHRADLADSLYSDGPEIITPIGEVSA